MSAFPTFVQPPLVLFPMARAVVLSQSGGALSASTKADLRKRVLWLLLSFPLLLLILLRVLFPVLCSAQMQVMPPAAPPTGAGLVHTHQLHQNLCMPGVQSLNPQRLTRVIQGAVGNQPLGREALAIGKPLEAAARGTVSRATALSLFSTTFCLLEVSFYEYFAVACRAETLVDVAACGQSRTAKTKKNENQVSAALIL